MLDDPRYAALNSRVYPPLTRVEAHLVALKVLRKFGSPEDAAMRERHGIIRAAHRGELSTIYRRYTHESGGRLGRMCWASTRSTTGHDKGWGRLIHDLSHMVHEYRHPGHRSHEHGHEAIELAISDWVTGSGLVGIVLQKREKPKVTPGQRRSLKLNSITERLAKWETKRKRAVNAIRKLGIQKRRLERAQQLSEDMTEANANRAHDNEQAIEGELS